MHKLTNSFYRYFKVRCERLDFRALVRKHTHLSCRRETSAVDCESKSQFHSTPCLEKHSKKVRIKIPPLNIKKLNKSNEMGEPSRPSNSHVTYSGCYSFSTDGSGGVWTLFNNQEDDDQPSDIPSDFRSWETVCQKYRQGNPFKFTVCSYNILSQDLLEAHSFLYKHCAPKNLKWDIRFYRLFNEILNLNPDILCLQEVQVSHLAYINDNFEKLGYAVIYKQKTGTREDGCAIYFRKSHFDLLDHMSVEFYQPDLPILNRDNIGVMVKLAPKGAGPPIVVATTHLLYNPKRTDVRLAQMQVFLAEIDRFSYFTHHNECGHLPVILTGDFNSLPESPVIELLDRGKVSARKYRDNSDWERIEVMDNCQHLSVYLDRQHGKQTPFDRVKIFNSERRSAAVCPNTTVNKMQYSKLFNSGDLGHNLKLVSAYDKRKVDGNYEATTHHGSWVTIDYIYYSNCRYLRLKSRLRLPVEEECGVLNRLPNEVYGSDHLALAARFELYIR